MVKDGKRISIISMWTFKFSQFIVEDVISLMIFFFFGCSIVGLILVLFFSLVCKSVFVHCYPVFGEDCFLLLMIMGFVVVAVPFDSGVKSVIRLPEAEIFLLKRGLSA